MYKRKICVVTGSRADYGLLYWIMKEIQADDEFELQVAVTGMHLSPEFGLTYKVIEKDGFDITESVETLLSSDKPSGIAKSIGLGVIGFADAFARMKPDLVVLLGDRYEIFAAAQAAMAARIPIAHIAGGDITEGAIDESIRHSITKMAHLHFVTNALSARRVQQMGENPAHIFNIGDPGIDAIKHLKLLERRDLEHRIHFRFKNKNLLVTYHPVTLDKLSSCQQMRELLTALDNLEGDTGIVFTGANADAEGRQLNNMIKEFVDHHCNAAFRLSLGQLLYLNTVANVDAVVGNSSSGIYEVPSFKKPTVNIGDRQKGRLQADSIINCEPKAEQIKAAVSKAYRLDCTNVQNPYGAGDSSKQMVAILKRIKDYRCLLKKRFFEVK